MSRVFLSHSRRDSRQAVALHAWLVEAEPGLESEIFLDLDRETGIAAGTRWKDALRGANEPALDGGHQPVVLTLMFRRDVPGKDGAARV